MQKGEEEKDRKVVVSLMELEACVFDEVMSGAGKVKLSLRSSYIEIMQFCLRNLLEQRCSFNSSRPAGPKEET
jgi:hypothetical protein